MSFFFLFPLFLLIIISFGDAQPTINITTYSPAQLSPSSSSNSLQLIQTTMLLTSPFHCNNQLEKCFQQRFATCFALESWFHQNSINVAVYRTYLPQGAKNISTSRFVTVMFQLLSIVQSKTQNSAPVIDTFATSSLLSSAGTGTNNQAKCAFAGLGSDGFKLLQPWKEPLPPPGDLSENWFGIGMSILCAFVPCILLSLNVYRRWRKITNSNKNFLKVMKDLRRHERGNSRKRVKSGSSSSSSSSENGSVDSDFESMVNKNDHDDDDDGLVKKRTSKDEDLLMDEEMKETKNHNSISQQQNISSTASASGMSQHSGEERSNDSKTKIDEEI